MCISSREGEGEVEGDHNRLDVRDRDRDDWDCKDDYECICRVTIDRDGVRYGECDVEDDPDTDQDRDCEADGMLMIMIGFRGCADIDIISRWCSFTLSSYSLYSSLFLFSI